MKKILKFLLKHKYLAFGIVLIVVVCSIFIFRKAIYPLVFVLLSFLGLAGISQIEDEKVNNIIDKIDRSNKDDKEYIEDTNNYLDDIRNGKFRKDRRTKKNP